MHETPMLHDTVRANIAWGAINADMDFLRKCAEMAHALEFIDKLPNGFHTVVGEKGGRLSGGQKQRLALARALYRRPALLLLDEPTSALDGESEAAVQRALENLRGKCTMVIVTHRLRTANFADRIIVLDNGCVVEEGQWGQLMSRPDSRLRELVSLQSVQ
jgi:ABC-type multidrug transport system fused ATPase/permease subunit